MCFFKKRSVLLSATINVAVVTMLLALAGRSPTLAQSSSVFEKIRVRPQSVEVRDAEGTSLGSGDFRSTVSSNRSGRTNGKAELQMPDFTIELEFTGVDEILYEASDPVGVVLVGRATFDDGDIEMFQASVTVRSDPDPGDTLTCAWDLDGDGWFDFSFDAEGTLQFREQ